jgi:2-succinyl-6-hydroxy-2,4-cyclohexadiene-1-carboxylate synthase
MQLRWQVHQGRGPHLLLVHGFLTGPAQWLRNLPGLSEHFTPVTVSLWGHAGAPSPAQVEAYDPDAYVAAFESLRQALGIDSWWLLGYSLGAGLTIRYALTYPQHVVAHAFTNSTSAMADAAQQRSWEDGAEASARRIEDGGVAAMERIPVHPRHARKLPPDIYAALCADAARHEPIGIANTLRRTNPRVSVRSRLADNRRPALLLCGARERRFKPHRDHAASHMADLTIVDLDAGHGMNMEAPEAFNAALIDFLRACPTS